MKTRFYLLTIAILGNLLVISGAYSKSSILAVRNNAVELSTKERSLSLAKSASQPEIVAQVDKIAQQITVRIDSTKHGNGSGVIVAKEGDTYYVLTVNHVVSQPDEYTLVTPDAKQHKLDEAKIKTFQGVDLALVQFVSQESYQVATLANYYISGADKYGGFDRFDELLSTNDPETIQNFMGALIFTSGFPQSSHSERQFTAGFAVPQAAGLLEVQNSYSLANGYGLIYTNQSYPGMSGGPVLDHLGRVIGINTAAEAEINFDREGKRVDLYLGRSLGVPIRTFINLTAKANFNLNLLKIESTDPPALSSSEINTIRQTLLSASVPPKDASEFDWLNYCNQLWRFSKYREAVAACDRAIQLKPDFYQAYYVRGLALYELNKYLAIFAQINPAIKKQINVRAVFNAFDRASRINPNFYEAWRKKAEVLSGVEKYSEALVAVEKAIELNPDDSALYVLRGYTLMGLKRLTEAREAFTKAIELKAEVQGYMGRVVVRMALQDYQGAIADCTAAIALNPNDAGYLLRGLLYFASRDFPSAIADFNRSLQDAPNDSFIGFSGYMTRGFVLSEMGDYQGAIADYSQIINLTSKMSERKPFKTLPSNFGGNLAMAMYAERAKAYVFLGDSVKAIADVDKAVELQPQNASSYSNRATVRARLGDLQGAIADCNKAIKLKSDDSDAYTLRGLIFSKQGDFQKALADVDKGWSLEKNNAETLYLTGLVKYEMGEVEEAIALWQKVAQIQKFSLKPSFTIAVALYGKGEQKQAVTIAQKALQLDKRLNNLDYLKKNLWGDRLLADAQKLLEIFK